jgi:hypothetical protein
MYITERIAALRLPPAFQNRSNRPFNLKTFGLSCDSKPGYIEIGLQTDGQCLLLKTVGADGSASAGM